MKISACYIVKNEEKNLGKSIDSIKGEYDELIVVDTGSTDKTVEIAKQKGADVFYFKWVDDFSKARNFALSLVHGDWIIFLDADEFYFGEVKLRSYIENKLLSDAKIDAFLISVFQMDKMDLPPLRVARIFRNDKQICYQGVIHETIIKLNGNLSCYDATEDLHFQTNGYANEVMPRKLQRNLDLLLKDVAENGEKQHYYYYIAECYFGQKDYQNAKKYIQKAIASPARHLFEEANYYHILIESMRQCGDPLEEMSVVASKAIKLFPELPEFYGEQGIIMSCMGELDDALLMLLQCVYLYRTIDKKKREFGYLTDESMHIIYQRITDIVKIMDKTKYNKN